MTYDKQRIAWELENTALNNGYWGNGLRVAKDIPGVESEERALLDRWLSGLQTDSDGFSLQDLANKLRQSDK